MARPPRAQLIELAVLHPARNAATSARVQVRAGACGMADCWWRLPSFPPTGVFVPVITNQWAHPSLKFPGVHG